MKRKAAISRAPRWQLWAAVLFAATLAAYGNHFENGFHFDDANVILDNPHIRNLGNIPRFFVDPTTYSSLPDHHIYRPVTLASLAVDYRIAGGLKPFAFHFSTFCWYLLQLLLMFFLFRRLMDAADPHASNFYVAMAAAAIYALHPANAETVNYINQRADLFATLGTVASVLWFAARPEQRRRGWYLLPAIAAFFAKPPVLIFPFVFLYSYLFEQGGALVFADWRKAVTSLRATLAALIVMAVSVIFAWRMTPSTFDPGGASPWMYRLTQPWVSLHYFKSFFLPTELSADTDWTYVRSALSGEAVAGYAFVAGLFALAVWASRRAESRPVAYGILWFFVALLPTSLVPLAEVTNDHRMFFPFVGLGLAVVWGARLIVLRKTERLTGRLAWRNAAIAALVVALIGGLYGTRMRNSVWRADETLWRDVVEKSPANGRGWMNYGLVFLARGDYRTATSHFERALRLAPNYWTAEVNYAIALGDTGRGGEAESHFQRSVALAPALADPRFFYARWLAKVGRAGEAAGMLREALRLNPALPKANELLAEVEARLTVDAGRMESLSDPRQLVELSDQLYRAGQFEESLRAAARAAELQPQSADAYNNMAAAYNAMARWNDGVRAAREAVRIRPDFQLAINNLEWALRRQLQK